MGGRGARARAPGRGAGVLRANYAVAERNRHGRAHLRGQRRVVPFKVSEELAICMRLCTAADTFSYLPSSLRCDRSLTEGVTYSALSVLPKSSPGPK